MALFRRKKRSSPSGGQTGQAAGQTGQAAGQVGGVAGRAGQVAGRTAHQPWLDHGLANGAAVACRRCSRGLKVRLQSPSSVTVSHDGALAGMALICTECGRLLCADCALAASNNPYMPKCDRCQSPVTVPMSR